MKVLSLILFLLSFSAVYSIELTYDRYRNNLRGLKYYEDGNIEKSQEYFERNVINHPGNGYFHFNFGNTLYNQGKFDQAITEYGRALSDSDFTPGSLVKYNIGNALFEQQEYEEALKMFREAIISDPNNNDARYNYELTQRMLQQSQQEQKPQSGKDDSESEQEEEEQKQEHQQDSDDSDEQKGDDTDTTQDFDDDSGHENRERDIDQQKDLENAKDILRTLSLREKELLEDEKERRRQELELEGKFW